ncbi:MAG: hypothetical protein ACK53Y_03775, partial [bacterium]
HVEGELGLCQYSASWNQSKNRVPSRRKLYGSTYFFSEKFLVLLERLLEKLMRSLMVQYY